MIVTIGGQEVALKLPVRYRRTEVLSHDHGVAVVKADPNARVDELRVEVLHRRERLRRGQCGAAALRTGDRRVDAARTERVREDLGKRARHTAMLRGIFRMVR